MARRVYGHLGDVRHRAEVVEYRVEQYWDKLQAGLERFAPDFSGEFDTTVDTATAGDAAK